MMMRCTGTCFSWQGMEMCRSRTFTPLRARSEGPEGDEGPRILRSRYGLGRFGLGLTTQEQAQADGDAVLMLRTLVLAEVAAEGLKAKGIGKKH